MKPLNKIVENKEKTVMEFYSSTFFSLHEEILKGGVYIKTGDELKDLESESIKCLILPDTLNYVLDYENILKQCLRVLKKEGVILCTCSCIAPSLDSRNHLWGFTPNAVQYIFEKFFNSKDIHTVGYGNVLTGRFTIEQLSITKLKQKDVVYYDPFFPVLIGVKAIKK